MKIGIQAVLFVAGVVLIASSPRAWAHTDVTAEQARDLIDSTEGLIVVDVRERSEYCDPVGHIPGAVNYPLNSGVLQARYEELPSDGPILVVCRSGARSNAAAAFLDSKGFSNVYDMLGGMGAWTWETAPRDGRLDMGDRALQILRRQRHGRRPVPDRHSGGSDRPRRDPRRLRQALHPHRRHRPRPQPPRTQGVRQSGHCSRCGRWG